MPPATPTAPPAPPVTELVATALAHSPALDALDALRAQGAAASAREAPAAALLDPMVEATFQDVEVASPPIIGAAMRFMTVAVGKAAA